MVTVVLVSQHNVSSVPCTTPT